MPGDFFTNEPENQENAADYNYVSQLRKTINTLKPIQPLTSHASSRPIFVHKDLQTCNYVFVRVDAVKKPLQPPYEGPYKVIDRDGKIFTVQLPQRQARISIDRLKPAYTVIETDGDGNNTSTVQNQANRAAPQPQTIPTSEQQPSTLPQYKTRVGRTTRLPVRFA